jgi:hypothetical protein
MQTRGNSDFAVRCFRRSDHAAAEDILMQQKPIMGMIQ